MAPLKATDVKSPQRYQTKCWNF